MNVAVVRKSVLALMILVWLSVFSIYCCSAERIPVAIVEQVISDGSITAYKMVQPGNTQSENSRLLSVLSGPVSVVQCNKDKITYVDPQGILKEILLVANLENRTLWSTRIDPSVEDFTNRVILQENNEVLYVGVNTHPGEVKVNKGEYRVESYSSDGSESILAAGQGKVYGVLQSSSNGIEIIASTGLFRMDLISHEVIPIGVVDSAEMINLQLLKDGYSFFARDNYIEVKHGLFGKALMEHSFTEGFEIAVDFSLPRKSFLTIRLGSDHQVLETNLATGNTSLIYKGDSIATACYID